jgi:hypothetical protein
MEEAMTGIVISERYGGFGVSEAAFERLKELGVALDRIYAANDLPRDDTRLVQVVQELGEAAAGRYADLKIVEIPDGVSWHIHEYDGYESVHEDHRSWTSDGVDGNCR